MTVSSVIICTYNRAHLLKRVLISLERQTIGADQFDIIVVDDGSNDPTASLCEAMKARLSNMRYVFTGQNIGKGAAASLGVKSAKGNTLLFLDDDCIANPDWVERMTSALGEHPIVMGAITSSSEDYIKLCHNIAHFYRFMPGKKNLTRGFIAGANMGLKREVFEAVGGFQEMKALAFDTEFIFRCRKKGYKLHFASEAVVEHDPEDITLLGFFKHSIEHAFRTIQLRNEHKVFLRTPFFLQSRELILLAAPLISMGVTLNIYMQNINLLKLFWTIPLVYGAKLAWCIGAARGLQRRVK